MHVRISGPVIAITEKSGAKNGNSWAQQTAHVLIGATVAQVVYWDRDFPAVPEVGEIVDLLCDTASFAGTVTCNYVSAWPETASPLRAVSGD